MKKVFGLVVTVAAVTFVGCGGSGESTGTSGEKQPTTSDPCPPDELMSDSGCIPIEPPTTTTTTTTLPPEAVAFEAEYAKLSYELQDNFTGLSSGTVALRICDDDAELVFVGMIGVEHYPDLARAGYAWKCPERVKPHDDAVLAAIAEAERRRQEEVRAEVERQREAAAAQERGINAEEFAQVQNGMTVGQVEAIIGSPGEVIAETNIAGYVGLMLMWNGETGTGLGANANFQFQDGVLIAKAQFGL